MSGESNTELSAYDLARLVEEARAERDRLREALHTVAQWDAAKAADHGNVGVREFAEKVLRDA